MLFKEQTERKKTDSLIYIILQYTMSPILQEALFTISIKQFGP